MNEELYYLKLALTFKYGALVGLTTWQTAIRACMVFINSKLEEFMSSALPEDKEWVTSLLNRRSYRVAKFLLNAVLSLKIPGGKGLPAKPDGTNGTVGTKTT